MLKHEPFQTVTSLVHGRLAFTRPLRGRHNRQPPAQVLCEGDKLFLWCLTSLEGQRPVSMVNAVIDALQSSQPSGPPDGQVEGGGLSWAPEAYLRMPYLTDSLIGIARGVSYLRLLGFPC